MLLRLGLLLLSVRVGATNIILCEQDEYFSDDGLCCRLCPAGFRVSQPCSENHGMVKCVSCEAGTFMKHPNGRNSCFKCWQCGADQETVAACNQTANQQCQCRSGYFCPQDEHCPEHCFRCSSCPHGILRPCNATEDSVCASPPPQPGSHCTLGLPTWAMVVTFIICIFFLACYLVKRFQCGLGRWLSGRALA
ncbi:tumor necrosis factor receptor superfamily member 26-like [Dipodomys merriami]|uniref:tumor necrosis factor receptor superfamily member 26-like n=1 Tax=Dipodomys merriami TaxID=94247 RepID=UPI003855C1FB